jgi:hypothetical protein
MNTSVVNVRTWGGTYPAYADEYGIVRVYDSIAGHYTVCHSLTPRQQARVRRLTCSVQKTESGKGQ